MRRFREAILEEISTENAKFHGNSWNLQEILTRKWIVKVDTAGCQVRVLPPATDYKRAFDGDQGPNTGGMGAICPVHLEPDVLKEIEAVGVQR